MYWVVGRRYSTFAKTGRGQVAIGSTPSDECLLWWWTHTGYVEQIYDVNGSAAVQLGGRLRPPGQ
jgi:hypothetical protein